MVRQMKITKRQLKRIIKEEKSKLLREASGGNPKDVFYDVILPALESAGYKGISAFKMARDAVDAGFADMRQMFGEGKIRKEKRMLSESSNLPGYQADPGEGQDITDGYYNAISQLIFDDMAAAGVDPHETPEEIEYAVAALQNLITDLQAGNY